MTIIVTSPLETMNVIAIHLIVAELFLSGPHCSLQGRAANMAGKVMKASTLTYIQIHVDIVAEQLLLTVEINCYGFDEPG